MLGVVTAIAVLGGTLAAAGARWPEGQNPLSVTAENYVMDVTLDPRTGALDAKADVTFRCAAGARAIELLLNPALKLIAVRDAEGKALDAVRSSLMGSATLGVRLAQACPAGGAAKLRFEYAGTLRMRQPFYPSERFLLLRDDDEWYPLGGAFDFAESDVKVRVPAGYEARTSGNLVERKVEGEQIAYHWKTGHAEDGRALLVYPMPRRSSEVQTMELPAAPGTNSGAPPLVRVEEVCNYDTAARLDFGGCGTLAKRAADIVQRFTQMLGPPPEKLLTIVPGPWGGESAVGYSAPALLVVSDWGARFAGVAEYAPEFLAHEIAHQWFPDAVAPASAGDGWLAESLAEYLAWRYLLRADPEAARAMVEKAMRDGVAYAPARPLSLGLELMNGASEEQEARATLYERGMLVFRTLETVIDRERVDRVLPEFYRRFAGRSASIADFQAVCEEMAGRKLGWFFDYYINGTRIPTIELKRGPSETPAVAAGEILVQDFPPEGSVRVEMTVRTAEGLVQHSVATRGAETPFTVNVPAPAMGITLDPDLRILRWTAAAERSRTQTEILAAVPEPITRENLPAAIEIYRRALAADPQDASERGQSLRERLGELEYAADKWSEALADLEAAINGHSISTYETYLWRTKAYLYHGVVELHDGRPKAALADAQSAMQMPRMVLERTVPERPVESQGGQTLEQLLRILTNAATHY